MQLDRKNALKLWENAFGKAVEVADFAGRKINKSAYDQKSSKYGWEVAFILPKVNGGRDVQDNLLCIHVETANEKGDEFPCFVANDRKYRISQSEENGKWSIDLAVDEESIAEQEAKTAAALARWDELFGAEYDRAVDFCGRMIHKCEYNTESEYAWKIAPYVESKPMDNKNAYIANLSSIEEALGKTAFKANGKNFTLNKDNGSYYFKVLEPKIVKQEPEKAQETAPVQEPQAPKETAPVQEQPVNTFNVKDPYDVAGRIVEIGQKYAAGANGGVMLDFLVIRAVTKPGSGSAVAATVNETVSMILKEGIGDWISVELSETSDEQGVRYMFMTYRFESPQPSDFERVFIGAKLLNTYSPVLLGALGLDELKIYNYATFVDCAHVNYPVGLLCGHYPQLRALLDSVYGSAYGFYAGECTTTLYVSHFIVFNVPMLAQMYPENATQYLTDAEMVEHNYPLEDVSNAIRAMLMGGREEPQAEQKVAPEMPTEAAPEAPQTVEVAEQTEAEVENNDEVPTEEPVEVEPEEPVKEAEEPNRAQELASTLAQALAHKEETEPTRTPAFPMPTEESGEEQEPLTVKTPEGDQITMEIPADEPTEEYDEDDDIITLDLDSID